MQILALTSLFLVSFLTLEIDSASTNSSVSVATANSSSNDLQPFIVGGVEANKNEFPWLVRLTIRKGNSAYLCGGALIKLGVVLTAAHCVSGVSGANIVVLAGDHDTAIKENSEQNQTGKTVRVHENYSSSNRGELNDIAVIILQKEFNQTAYVRSINLPRANSTTSSNGTVAGWGRLQYDGTLPRVLMKVTIPIVTYTSPNCTSQVRDRNTQVCAGQSGKDSCQGDSGGPLMCRNSTNAPYEVCGIVSYGFECARPNYPGVYTKVSSYINWINYNGDERTTTTKRTTTTTRTTTLNNSNRLIHDSQFILLLLFINFLFRY